MIIPKNLMLYIDVALSTKRKHPDYPILDKEVIKMVINLDCFMAYGLEKLEYKRFKELLGLMFR